MYRTTFPGRLVAEFKTAQDNSEGINLMIIIHIYKIVTCEES